MTPALWLVAALACAQLDASPRPTPEEAAGPAQVPAENVPAPRAAPNRISAVTVYQGNALVTREVGVPEGDGTIELVVTPLPAQTIDSSLYAEGADGLRVLSTRYRTRAVKDDTRAEVRAKEQQLQTLQAAAERLEKEVAARGQDLQYLQKLEGFTGTALTGLADKGRIDSRAILSLSRFIMEGRGEKTRAEVDLRQQIQANAEAVAFARRQLDELSAGSSRIERDAVIVVHKARRDAGTVRLGYLVGSATWSPQYRLRGTTDNAPVRLDYLAAVVQQTGEAWPDVRITLSTARPSLDAAPPDLLPLRMAVAETADAGPIEANDEGSRRIAAELERPLEMSFANETPLEDVLKYVRDRTKSRAFPEGIPVYLDPIGLQEAEKTSTSPVTIDLARVPLKTSLKLLLGQLGLTYVVSGGVLKITSTSSEDLAPEAGEPGLGGMGGLGGGMGGMGGMGLAIETAQAAGGAVLNQAAATDQARELRVADGADPGPPPAEKDAPSVTFAIEGRLDVPSRRDPQLLEIARVELPAEYYAKAVPVLTPRVYRLAKVTNTSALVVLPGTATVYVGGDFVGRMRLPLVAAGEPFVAGFGVDPQLQVSRRLLRKARTLQGGNQIFTYEFRLGLRNYRPGPVKVQLWDRLPTPQGEAVVVNLVKTSAELSADPTYQRTARMDNLLRWDVDVPPGTVGDKTMYLNYEFRLEYARDLPRPRFASGDLREGPIGGGAMGGMGGMGFGFK